MWTVDYSYYTGVFLGTAVAEKDWTRIAREACAYIDEITYGRLRNMAEIPEEVKLAVCAVVDAVQAQRTAAARIDTAAGVKSFSNDGYSESFIDAVQLSADSTRRKADAAAVYLPRSHPLRYAGIYCKAVTTCSFAVNSSLISGWTQTTV